MASDLIRKTKDYSAQNQNLIHTVTETLSELRTVQIELEAHAVALIKNGVFSREVQRQARFESTQIQDGSVQEFVSKLALWADLLPYYQKLNRFNAELVPKIRGLLNRTTPATSTFLWLFTSAQKKHTATTAFNELEALMNDLHYIQDMNSTCSFVSEYKSGSADDALSRLYNNPIQFRTAFLSLNLSGATVEVKIPEFEEALSTITPILYKYNQLMEEKEHLSKQIKKQAELVAAEEVLSQLEKVDVSTVNYEKKGIRFKTLSDYNYKTLADIYNASLYHLVSVPGITHETAEILKKTVQHYADEIGNKIKIRLSNDHKTKNITTLLEYVSAYLSRRDSFTQIESWIKKHPEVFVTAYGNIQKIPKSIMFLWTPSVEKVNALQSYREIRHFCQSTDYYELKKAITRALDSQAVPSDVWSDFNSNTVAYLNILEALVPNLFGSGSVSYGLPEDLARAIQEEHFFPDGLHCELFPYQIFGIKYILHQGKALLGDEMGLGKTIQAIGTMVSLRYTGATHFMVICPASVLANWCKEVTKFSDLRVIQIYGRDRKAAFRTWLRSGGVGITTYETCSFLDFEKDAVFNLLVVDEAHYIKNPEAKRTIRTREIAGHAKRLLFMTGTPLENKVGEMQALIEVLRPDIGEEIAPLANLLSAPLFREKIAPVYYRRKRDDVLTELPELVSKDEWCPLTEEENLIYEESALGRKFMEMRQLSWNAKHSSKAERMREIVEEASENGYKTLIFSFFLETGRKVRETLGNRCMPIISGSTPPNQRQEIIDQFNASPDGSVLIAQIQAGGTGLNIQAASVVIICEPQLKPSIEDQAISRAYRFGQHNTVFVYRLLSPNTSDERINDMLYNKRKEFEAFADESVAAKSMNHEIEIDKGSINKIIQDEIDRINAKGGRSQTSRSEENDMDDEEDATMPSMNGRNTRDEGTSESSSKSAESAETHGLGMSSTFIPEKKAADTETTIRGASAKNGDNGNADEDIPDHSDQFESKTKTEYRNLAEFAFMINHTGLEYKESTAKGGCFWVRSNPLIDPTLKSITIGGKRLGYAKAAKAFNGEAGWYYKQ